MAETIQGAQRRTVQFHEFRKTVRSLFHSIQNFYDLYVTLVDDNKLMPYMTEKPGAFGPVVSDVDLRYPLEIETRQYDFEMIKTLVSSYFKNFKKYLNTTEVQLQCFVFEREEPYQTEKETKDGWHLMFPYLRPHAAVKHMVRLDVIEDCREILATLGTMNSVEDIVDVAVISRNNWFMFGSGKPNLASYQLTHVLNEKTDEIEHDLSFKELVWLLRVNRTDRNDVYIGDMSDEKVESLYKKRVALEKAAKRKGSKSCKEVVQRETAHTTGQSVRSCEEVSFDLLEKSVMSLGTHRAAGLEPGWIEVIWAIKNVCEANGYAEKWRGLAHKWSETGGRAYAADDVDKKLDRIRDRRAGETKMMFGSVKSWLRQDDPQRFWELYPQEALPQHLVSFRKLVTETPKTDSPYARMFIDQYLDQYINCGSTVREFNGVRYAEVDDKTMKDRIEKEAEKGLTLVGRQIKMEEVALDAAGSRNAESRDKLKQEYAAIKAGFQYIRREHNVASVLNSLKNKVNLAKFDEVLDSNPFLFCCENGVWDLREGHIEFRQGRPEDYNTLSTGYSYFDELNPQDEETRRAFEAFVEAAYPLEDERRAMQEYVGYCLLALHTEKKFAIFLDKRRGFNSKSSVTSLLMKTFGPNYSCQPRASFLYKKDVVRDENEHSAGMLSYRHVRLIVVEELDPLKNLDEQTLKQANGGGWNNRGRVCGLPVVKEYPWISKLIMCCNSGNVPHFDVTDAALIQRIYAVPHRARFYPDKIGYELAVEKNIPYSHRADSTISENYAAWRPYMLNWCIQGLIIYYQNRFSSIPASFKEFADSVVAERNTCKDFLDEAVERSNDQSDYVVRADLFQEFEKKHAQQQRDRKLRVDKKKFIDLLTDYLGEDCHEPKLHGRSDVFVGWRYTATEF